MAKHRGWDFTLFVYVEQSMPVILSDISACKRFHKDQLLVKRWLKGAECKAVTCDCNFIWCLRIPKT